VPSETARALFVVEGVPEARLRVVRLGVTVPSRQPRRTGSRKTRVLFSASDPFRKGVRVLLDAWARARLPRARLQIVASRDVLTSRQLTSALVADPTIDYLPFLPQARFLALLDQADLLVLPSLEDGFPFDVRDAMARGIPAIVSDQTGVHEILTDGEDGWIVPAGDAGRLADVLALAIGDPARRRGVGVAARETMSHWTWRRFDEAFAEAVFS
jgi:glycosyltransferase involved in cell wall biosynthesis